MKRTFWVAVFRAPADNYEHLHVSRVNSDGPSKKAAENVLKANTNADIHIDSIVPMRDHEHLTDVVAKVIEANGPEYRPMQESEQFMTARKAYKLRTEEGLSTSNIRLKDAPLTAAEKSAESIGELMTDPPEIITPSGIIQP